MRAAKVQASLRIRAVSPEPPLLAHTSSESRGTFKQKARSLAPLNGWACAVKICHDGMLEDTNSLDAVQIYNATRKWLDFCMTKGYTCRTISLRYIVQLPTTTLWCTGNNVSTVRFAELKFDWTKRLFGSHALTKRLNLVCFFFNILYSKVRSIR